MQRKRERACYPGQAKAAAQMQRDVKTDRWDKRVDRQTDKINGL